MAPSLDIEVAPMAREAPDGDEEASLHKQPEIVFATSPNPIIEPTASQDVTDPNFGRLLLERYGVPRERFVGNMLVLARDARGRPTAMLGPYWTMLVFVTIPLAVYCPALAVFLWCDRLAVWVQVVYACIVAFTFAALLSTATRNPGMLPRFDAVPECAMAWTWNDQAKTYKPPGSRYCNWCDATFLDFDHTCPWTGTAIAKGNMGSFKCFVGSIQLLFYATIVIFVLGALGELPRTDR